MERAVHDELVKKAVIINREGKPYKIPAAEALRLQEETPEYRKLEIRNLNSPSRLTHHESRLKKP